MCCNEKCFLCTDWCTIIDIANDVAGNDDFGGGGPWK